MLACALLLGLCLLQGPREFESAQLMTLGGLLLLSDLLALPLPKRGFLSYSFIWAFVLCATSGSTVASLALSLSLLVRFSIFGVGGIQRRIVDLSSEMLPALLSLCLLQTLGGSRAAEISTNHVAVGVALIGYYLAGIGALSYLYGPISNSASDLVKGSMQSRNMTGAEEVRGVRDGTTEKNLACWPVGS